MEFTIKIGQIESLIILEALSDYKHNSNKHNDDREIAERLSKKFKDEIRNQWDTPYFKNSEGC